METQIKEVTNIINTYIGASGFKLDSFEKTAEIKSNDNQTSILIYAI